MKIKIVEIEKNPENSRFDWYIKIDAASYKLLYEELVIEIQNYNIPAGNKFDFFRTKTIEFIKDKLKENLHEFVSGEELENMANKMMNDLIVKLAIQSLVSDLRKNVVKKKELTRSIEEMNILEEDISKDKLIILRLQKEEDELKNELNLSKECLYYEVTPNLNNSSTDQNSYMDTLLNHSNTLLNDCKSINNSSNKFRNKEIESSLYNKPADDEMSDGYYDILLHSYDMLKKSRDMLLYDKKHLYHEKEWRLRIMLIQQDDESIFSDGVVAGHIKFLDELQEDIKSYNMNRNLIELYDMGNSFFEDNNILFSKKRESIFQLSNKVSHIKNEILNLTDELKDLNSKISKEIYSLIGDRIADVRIKMKKGEVKANEYQSNDEYIAMLKSFKSKFDDHIETYPDEKLFYYDTVFSSKLEHFKNEISEENSSFMPPTSCELKQFYEICMLLQSLKKQIKQEFDLRNSNKNTLQ